MDYGSYRIDPRPSASSGYPVTTITTGIPLSKRFEILEHTKVNVYANEGYGISSSPQMNPFAMRGPGPGVRGRGVGGPRGISAKNRQLALALARKSKSALGVDAVAQRLRVPVQARLGMSRGMGRGRVMTGRRGMPISRGGRVGVGGGGGGIRQLQKTSGSIVRRGSPTKLRGAVRGRGVGGGRGGPGAQSRGGTFNARGGRGGPRGRGGIGRGRGGNPTNQKVSREDLDTELDSYMAKTKGYLDRQLDDYMSQVKASQAAISAGSLPTDDADVTMTEA